MERKLQMFKKAIILLLLSPISCLDVNHIPDPGIPLRSTEDLELAVLHLYDLFDTNPQVAFSTYFTDEGDESFYVSAPGLYRLILNPSSVFPHTLWNNSYRAIYTINTVLEAGRHIIPREGEVARYNEAIGTAHALRAWAHFELLSYMSEDLEDETSKGVVFLNFVPSHEHFLARFATGEVIEGIKSDLAMAENLISTESNTTFLSQDFCTALRARMSAYIGDHEAASVHAVELINKYVLADRDQYVNMWLDNDNTEVIFKLERTIGDNHDIGGDRLGANGGWIGSIFTFSESNINGSTTVDVGRSLYNMLDDDDIRKEVILDPSSVINPDYPLNQNTLSDRLIVNKYPGSEGHPVMNDLKIFRVSEMYLIMAEAAAFEGDFEVAASYVDEIRDARFGSDQSSPTYSTLSEALAGILDERRIELAFEGHRYLDLRRLGWRANRSIDRDIFDTCSKYGACSMAITDARWTVPIPQDEIDVNPNISQTVGY